MKRSILYFILILLAPITAFAQYSVTTNLYNYSVPTKHLIYQGQVINYIDYTYNVLKVTCDANKLDLCPGGSVIALEHEVDLSFGDNPCTLRYSCCYGIECGETIAPLIFTTFKYYPIEDDSSYGQITIKEKEEGSTLLEKSNDYSTTDNSFFIFP